MLKQILLLSLIFSFTVTTFAQTSSGNEATSSFNTNLSTINQASHSSFLADLDRMLFEVAQNNRYDANIQKYTSIKGSPYLFKNHRPGSIILNNDQVLNDVQLNYDVFEHSFIAYSDQDKVILLDPIYFKEVIFEDQHTQLVYRKSNPRYPERFYQSLYHKDHLTFYKETMVVLHKASHNGVLESPARFQQKSKYFVVKSGSDPIAVNLKKDDVFDHFPEIERVAINEIIKNKKIRLRKASDYEALLAMLNE